MELWKLGAILLLASVLLSGLYTYWAQERDERKKEKAGREK